MKKVLTLFSILVLFVACDCYQVVRGVVLDNTTKQPILGIEVYNKKKPYAKTQTDEHGNFELSSISGGVFCPPMEVVIEHADYVKTEIKIESGQTQEVFLQRK